MKKIIVVLVVIAMMFAMCACSSTAQTLNGETVEVSDGEVITICENKDFTIMRIDVVGTRVSNAMPRYDYLMVCANDECSFTCDIEIEDYTVFQEGDIVTGTIKYEYDAWMDDDTYTFYLGDSELHIRCFVSKN